MSKTKLAVGDPQSLSRASKRSVFISTSTKEVPERGTCRLRYSLLHLTEHPEKASVQVSVKESKRLSATKSLLWPMNCLPQSCMKSMSSESSFIRRLNFPDECVFQMLGLVNTHNTSFLGHKKPKNDSTI